jgi:hypothetical protein
MNPCCTSASVQQKKIMFETENVFQNTLPSWIHLLQDKVQWQTPVNTTIRLGLYNSGKSRDQARLPVADYAFTCMMQTSHPTDTPVVCIL